MELVMSVGWADCWNPFLCGYRLIVKYGKTFYEMPLLSFFLLSLKKERMMYQDNLLFWASSASHFGSRSFCLLCVLHSYFRRLGYYIRVHKTQWRSQVGCYHCLFSMGNEPACQLLAG